MQRFLFFLLLAALGLTACLDRAASNRSGVGNPTAADSAAMNTTSASQPITTDSTGSVGRDSASAGGGALPGRGANTRFGAGYSQDNSGSSNGVPKEGAQNGKEKKASGNQ